MCISEHKPVIVAFLMILASISSAPCQPGTRQMRNQRVLEIQKLISSNNLADADRLLNQCSAEYPGDSGFDNLRGIVAARKGNAVLAEKSFQKAIQRSPRFTAAYLNLGRLYQEIPDSDTAHRQKALHIYIEVLKYDPRNIEARYQSAFLLMRKGAFRQSLNQLALMSAETRSAAQVLSVTAADNAMLGRTEQASEAVSRWVAQPQLFEPDVQQALPSLASGKRYDLIVKLLERLQNEGPMSPELLNSLGVAYEETGHLKKARAVFESVFAQSGSSTAPLIELATVANKQLDYKGALGYLAHARVLEPKNAAIDYSFGVDCLYLDLLAEAQKAFSEAVALAPSDASYNYAMGITTSFMHDPNEGVPYLKKYVSLRPADPNGKLAVGTTLFRAKDYDSAISWLSKAAANPQTSLAAHYYLGRVANRQRRPDDAIVELQKVLKVKPENADALAELGQSYLLLKDYSRAEQELQRALVLEPDNYTANFNLLIVYMQEKDPRRIAQASRVKQIQNLEAAKKQEYLRVLEIRPINSAE